VQPRYPLVRQSERGRPRKRGWQRDSPECHRGKGQHNGSPPMPCAKVTRLGLVPSWASKIWKSTARGWGAGVTCLPSKPTATTAPGANSRRALPTARVRSTSALGGAPTSSAASERRRRRLELELELAQRAKTQELWPPEPDASCLRCSCRAQLGREAVECDDTLNVGAYRAEPQHPDPDLVAT
jgi:hypothetical protein